MNKAPNVPLMVKKLKLVTEGSAETAELQTHTQVIITDQ